MRTPRAYITALRALLAGALFAATLSAQALPLFARQTGQACVACHVSFPELTPYGRWFKLNGYTFGQRAEVPLAAMLNFGVERVATPTDATGAQVDPRDGVPTPSAASLFAGGRLNDHAGAFLQWTYQPFNYNYADPTQYGGYTHADNMDLRLVGRSEAAEGGFPEWVYGLTVHNNPTVQDVWNGTPAFGFPWQGPQFNPTPAAATLVDGGLAQSVVGSGAYLFWNRSLYAEFSLYRDATGPFSLLTWNVPVTTPLTGSNPYVRLAWNREWGPHSLEVGAYGARFHVLTSGTQGDPTDTFRDRAIDFQYQYITEPHTVSVVGSQIWENQHLGYTYGAGGSDNPDNTLTTQRIKATYFWHHRWGGSLGLFRTTGSSDATLYQGGFGLANSVPDSSGYVAELDYQPIPNVRLMAQYTGYRTFNGSSDNVDGMGRSAHDNNVLYLNLWVAY